MTIQQIIDTVNAKLKAANEAMAIANFNDEQINVFKSIGGSYDTNSISTSKSLALSLLSDALGGKLKSTYHNDGLELSGHYSGKHSVGIAVTTKMHKRKTYNSDKSYVRSYGYAETIRLPLSVSIDPDAVLDVAEIGRLTPDQLAERLEARVQSAMESKAKAKAEASARLDELCARHNIDRDNAYSFARDIIRLIDSI